MYSDELDILRLNSKGQSNCKMIYDVCVVGAGLTGSAAAKWLSRHKGTKVCLVGPAEPSTEEWLAGKRQIFGSHYDEGRIFRELDEDYDWGLLAQRSIKRYRDIEKESGIKFCQEVGCVFIDERGSRSLEEYRKSANDLRAHTEEYPSNQFHTRYPYLRIDPQCDCIWTPHNAGHISPRRLVAAQQRIAQTNGCDIIRRVVVRVTERPSERGEKLVEVETMDGESIHAKSVLLCTGAFTNFHDLLPGGTELDVNLSRNLVVKAELGTHDVEMLAGMPSVSLENKRAYILPPIQYPDGKYYLKIGLWCSFEDEMDDIENVAAWFNSRGRSYDSVRDTIQVLRDLIPDLCPVSLTTDCCVVTSTPSGRLYCDMVSSRVGALIGMNGVGAKSSDEIGRMGAALILAGGRWAHDLPHEHFNLRTRAPRGSRLKGKL